MYPIHAKEEKLKVTIIFMILFVAALISAWIPVYHAHAPLLGK